MRRIFPISATSKVVDYGTCQESILRLNLVVLAKFSRDDAIITPIMTGEQEGNFYKYQLARSAKARLRDSIETNSEDTQANLSGESSRVEKTIEQAMRNKDRLEAKVHEIPALKTYLERVSSVMVTREYMPRLTRYRTGIYLTSEGLILGELAERGEDSPLTGDVIVGQAGRNAAIDKFASMSPVELFGRVADRIDPIKIRK